MTPTQLSDLLPNKKECKWCGKSATSNELKNGGFISCCPDGKEAEHEYNQAIDACHKALMDSGFGVLRALDEYRVLDVINEYYADKLCDMSRMVLARHICQRFGTPVVPNVDDITRALMKSNVDNNFLLELNILVPLATSIHSLLLNNTTDRGNGK